MCPDSRSQMERACRPGQDSKPGFCGPWWAWVPGCLAGALLGTRATQRQRVPARAQGGAWAALDRGCPSCEGGCPGLRGSGGGEASWRRCPRESSQGGGDIPGQPADLGQVDWQLWYCPPPQLYAHEGAHPRLILGAAGKAHPPLCLAFSGYGASTHLPGLGGSAFLATQVTNSSQRDSGQPCGEVGAGSWGQESKPPLAVCPGRLPGDGF